MTFSAKAPVADAARRPRRVPGRATQNVGPGMMPGWVQIYTFPPENDARGPLFRRGAQLFFPTGRGGV